MADPHAAASSQPPSPVSAESGPSASLRARSRAPAPYWAAAELLAALAVIAIGHAGFIAFSSTPWLLALGAAGIWFRGPGWRAIGLGVPIRFFRVVGVALALGTGYNFVSLYLIEPVIARATSGALPDVSVFRPLVGNEAQLAFWLAISWTLAAFMEEMVYRGWIMSRIAELGRFTAGAWVGATIASSALFGAIHMYQGVSGVISTGLAGLFFATVYLASGRSLWTSIFAHGFVDTAGFVMIYLGVYPGL